MKQKLIFFLLFGFFSFLFPLSLYAADLQLNAVGNYEVGATVPNNITYTSSNVTFLGTALEEAIISVSVDDESETVTADSDGDWSYTTYLADGDHEIIISSGDEEIEFSLTIGEEEKGGTIEETLPTTGNTGLTIGFLSLGAIVTLAGFFLLKRTI